MITKEQFLTVIEVTKSSMDYDFLDKNQFIIIDIDMQHSKTYNELPDKIIGQWIIVISTYRWKNFGYTNYSYKTVGFYDKTFLKIDYIPFGFWLLKDIKFRCLSSDFFNQYRPVPVLEHRFNPELTSEDYEWEGNIYITSFNDFLKQIWDYEIEKKVWNSTNKKIIK